MNNAILDTMDFRYDGFEGNSPVRNKLFAVTITSRHGLHASVFKHELNRFLTNKKYPVLLKGNLEFHPKKPTAVHLHGFTSLGSIPQGNRTNEFHFALTPLPMGDTININSWYRYCYKFHRVDTIIMDW